MKYRISNCFLDCVFSVNNCLKLFEIFFRLAYILISKSLPLFFFFFFFLISHLFFQDGLAKEEEGKKEMSIKPSFYF